MKTTKEIFRKHTDEYFSKNKNDSFEDLPNDVIYSAMEDYAQMKVNELSKANVSGNEANPKENKKDGEVAVAFADWLKKNNWVGGYEYWWKENTNGEERFTTQKLFDEFEKAKSN